MEDLYGDLEDPFFSLEDAPKEENEPSISDTELTALKEHNTKLSSQNVALKMNISCLYKTAQLELERKESIIGRLMKRIKRLEAETRKSTVTQPPPNSICRTTSKSPNAAADASKKEDHPPNEGSEGGESSNNECIKNKHLPQQDDSIKTDQQRLAQVSSGKGLDPRYKDHTGTTSPRSRDESRIRCLLVDARTRDTGGKNDLKQCDHGSGEKSQMTATRNRTEKERYRHRDETKRHEHHSNSHSPPRRSHSSSSKQRSEENTVRENKENVLRMSNERNYNRDIERARSREPPTRRTESLQRPPTRSSREADLRREREQEEYHRKRRRSVSRSPHHPHPSHHHREGGGYRDAKRRKTTDDSYMSTSHHMNVRDRNHCGNSILDDRDPNKMMHISPPHTPNADEEDPSGGSDRFWNTSEGTSHPKLFPSTMDGDDETCSLMSDDSVGCSKFIFDVENFEQGEEEETGPRAPTMVNDGECDFDDQNSPVTQETQERVKSEADPYERPLSVDDDNEVASNEGTLEEGGDEGQDNNSHLSVEVTQNQEAHSKPPNDGGLSENKPPSVCQEPSPPLSDTVSEKGGEPPSPEDPAKVSCSDPESESDLEEGELSDSDDGQSSAVSSESAEKVTMRTNCTVTSVTIQQQHTVKSNESFSVSQELLYQRSGSSHHTSRGVPSGSVHDRLGAIDQSHSTRGQRERGSRGHRSRSGDRQSRGHRSHSGDRQSRGHRSGSRDYGSSSIEHQSRGHRLNSEQSRGHRLNSRGQMCRTLRRSRTPPHGHRARSARDLRPQ